jgi:Na+-transporting methylmalonyl-CoA/oxaloacetate decarboxylase gamma subunit
MNLFDFKSVLGKIMFIALIIIATHYHVLAGILAVLLVISMSQYVIEGMGNNTDSSKESADSTDSKESKESTDSKDSKEAKPVKESTEESPMSLFKKNNCKNGILMKDGKEITADSLKENFPNVKFDGDSCNPCGDDCKFQIVSSAERITNEENLRPQESNAQPVDRELVTKKQ